MMERENKYFVEPEYDTMNQTRTSRLNGKIVNQPRNRNFGSFSFALTFPDSPRAHVVFRDDSSDDDNNSDFYDGYSESQSEEDYSPHNEKKKNITNQKLSSSHFNPQRNGTNHTQESTPLNNLNQFDDNDVLGSSSSEELQISLNDKTPKVSRMTLQSQQQTSNQKLSPSDPIPKPINSRQSPKKGEVDDLKKQDSNLSPKPSISNQSTPLQDLNVSTILPISNSNYLKQSASSQNSNYLKQSASSQSHQNDNQSDHLLNSVSKDVPKKSSSCHLSKIEGKDNFKPNKKSTKYLEQNKKVIEFLPQPRTVSPSISTNMSQQNIEDSKSLQDKSKLEQPLDELSRKPSQNKLPYSNAKKETNNGEDISNFQSKTLKLETSNRPRHVPGSQEKSLKELGFTMDSMDEESKPKVIKDEDLFVKFEFKHSGDREKVSKAAFILYKDEMEKKFSSEYLHNLKADIKRKKCDTTNDGTTKVIITLYKTVKEHDNETANETEVFIGKYDLVLDEKESKKKYKFHDIGKENLITVKLSRSEADSKYKRVVKNWDKPASVSSLQQNIKKLEDK